MAVLFLAGYTIAFVLHCIGIILLYNIKMRLFNQRLILLNMAASECLFCLSEVIQWTRFDLLQYSNYQIYGTAYCYIERLGSYVSFISSKLLMIYLLMDRFLDIYLSLKYRLYFHKSITLAIIALLWGIAATVATILDVIYKCRALSELIRVYIALHVTTLVLIMLTYSYFYIRLRNSIKFRKVNSPTPLTRHRNNLMVPFLITLAYAVFNFTGMILLAILHFKKTFPSLSTLKAIYMTAMCLIIIGWISDATIYILLQNSIRNSAAHFARDLIIRWRRTKSVRVHNLRRKADNIPCNPRQLPSLTSSIRET